MPHIRDHRDIDDENNVNVIEFGCYWIQITPAKQDEVHKNETICYYKMWLLFFWQTGIRKSQARFLEYKAMTNFALNSIEYLLTNCYRSGKPR